MRVPISYPESSGFLVSGWAPVETLGLGLDRFCLRSPLSAIQIYTFIFSFRDFLRDFFRDFIRDFFATFVHTLRAQSAKAHGE